MMKSIFAAILCFLFFWCLLFFGIGQTALAGEKSGQDLDRQEKPVKIRDKGIPGKDELEAARIMDMLAMMDMLKHLDLMEDYEIIEEPENEKNN